MNEPKPYGNATPASQAATTTSHAHDAANGTFRYDPKTGRLTAFEAGSIRTTVHIDGHAAAIADIDAVRDAAGAEKAGRAIEAAVLQALSPKV